MFYYYAAVYGRDNKYLPFGHIDMTGFAPSKIDAIKNLSITKRYIILNLIELTEAEYNEYRREE